MSHPDPVQGFSYAGKVIAAPMVRVSQLAFRAFCAHHGADIVFSEEIICNRIVRCVVEDRPWSWPHTMKGDTTTTASSSGASVPHPDPDARVVELVDYEVRKGGLAKRSVIFQTLAKQTEVSANGGSSSTWKVCEVACPLVFQLGASDPSLAARAAAIVAPLVHGIDVNMGCPKKFSVDNGMGAALMKDVDRACAIVAAIREAIGPVKPLSFKTRLQTTVDESVVFLTRVARAGKVHSLTIHARSVDQRSEVPPRYADATEVARRLRTELPGVAIVFNGSLGEDLTPQPSNVAYAVRLLPSGLTSSDGKDLRLAKDIAAYVARLGGGKAALLKHATDLGFDGAMVARHAMWNPTMFGSCPNSNRVEVFRQFLRACFNYQAFFMNIKYHLTRTFQESQGDSPAAKDLYQGLINAKSYRDVAGVFKGFTAEEVSMFEQLDGTMEAMYDALVPTPSGAFVRGAGVVGAGRRTRSDDGAAATGGCGDDTDPAAGGDHCAAKGRRKEAMMMVSSA